MAETKGAVKGSSKQTIILIIALFMIFIFGRICPTWADVTREGVMAIGLFVGVIMMGTSGTGLIATCCIGLFAIVFNGLLTGPEVLAATWGNSLVQQMMLVFALFNGILASGVGQQLAKKIMCLKFAKGKPMIFTWVIFLAMSIGSAFLSSTNMTIFGFAILHSIREELGYEEDSGWFKGMIFGSFFSIVLGACLLPFKDMQMSVWANSVAAFNALGFEQNFPVYILVVLIVWFAMSVLLTLAMKPVFKADFSKLEGIDAAKLQTLQDNKFTRKQSILLAMGLLAMAYPVLVPLLPASLPGMAFVKSIGNAYWYLLVLFLLTRIKVDGEKIFNIDMAFKNGIIWGICCALMVFMLAGTLLSKGEWGVQSWLVSLFSPVFGAVPFPVYVLFASLCTVIITNLTSNNATAVVMGAVTAPFMLTFVNQGVNPYVYGPMMTMSAMFAWATMASGPISPLLIGEKCMQKDQKFLYKNGVVFSLTFIILNTVITTLLGYIL